MDANLSDELKKMDLKEGKNWNDLPTEIKMECVKRMSFMTRWALHNTSHSEKELVESTKWDGELLDITCWKFPTWDKKSVTCSSTSSSKFRFYFEQENLAALESVLRIAKFDGLFTSCDIALFQNLLAVSSRTPLNIPFLNLYEATKDDLEILKNCRGLEDLVILSLGKGITLRQLLDDYNEIIANTRSVVLDNSDGIELDGLIQLIENWIIDDKQLGSKFEIKWYKEEQTSNDSNQQVVDILEGLKSSFADRFQVTELGEEEVYISFKKDKYIKVYCNSDSFASLDVVDVVPN